MWEMTGKMKKRIGDNKVRVAIYVRVSTEHENQLYSFENQKQWCDIQVKNYKDWLVVEKYFDRGITGTQAKKRHNFMRMIKDSYEGKFDLIITREVSRFGRNIQDVINYSTDLKKIGVEIFFIDDYISTFSANGIEELARMAISAERESRKISERIKAGQEVARINNVLYGSGNILGYDRVGRTFTINEEQAETIKSIFKMYIEGNSLRNIRTELTKQQRKNSKGQVKWFESTISRILENPMYIGNQYQNKTIKEDFLSSKITYNDKSEYVIIKGDFKPIIDDEEFKRVQAIKEKKYKRNKKGRLCGIKDTKDKWMKVLECECGAKFQQYKCKKDKKTGIMHKEYVCRNRKQNGTTEFRNENNISLAGVCDIKTILSWHLELMIKDIFKEIWGYRKESIETVLNLIKENYVEDEGKNEESIDKLKKNIKKHEDKVKKLIDLCIEGIITKDELKVKKIECEKIVEIDRQELKEIDVAIENKAEIKNNKMKNIEKVLKNMADLKKETIDSNLINSIIDKVIVRENNTYEWYLNISGSNEDIFNIASNESLDIKRKHSLKVRYEKYTQIFTSTITMERAREYRKQCGTYIREDKWNDLNFEVYIR